MPAIYPPTITSVTPAIGTLSGGASVTIAGTNFLTPFPEYGTVSAVYFGSTPASSFTVDYDNQITAIAPAHAVGTVDITVVNAYGTSATSSSDQFTYSTSVPSISGIFPTSGPVAGGTPVLITGTLFTAATAVTFGGTAAIAFYVLNDTQISAIVPDHTAGTVNVIVTIPNGTVTGSSLYTYVANDTSTRMTVTITDGTEEAVGMADFTFDGNLVGAPDGSDYLVPFNTLLSDASGTLYPRFRGFFTSSNATYNQTDQKMHLIAYDHRLYLTKQNLNPEHLSLLPVPQQTAATNTGCVLNWKNAAHAFFIGCRVYGVSSGAQGIVIAVNSGTNLLTMYPKIGTFTDGEVLNVGDTLYAYADGHSVDVPYSTQYGSVYPETWVEAILGGTSWATVTGIKPYKIVPTTHDDDDTWDTDPVTGKVIPAVPFTWKKKDKKWTSLGDLTTYLRRIRHFKVVSDGSGGYCLGMYWVRQSQIDDATYGLDLPAPVTITSTCTFLAGGIELAQDGDNQVERVHLSGQTLSKNWIDSILPASSPTGPERVYYDEPANVRTQEDLDNLCSDLYTVYAVRSKTWTCTFVQRPDIEHYQLLAISGWGSVIPDGQYRIVKIQYIDGVDGKGKPVKMTQAWFVPKATFDARARLGWTYTDGIIQVKRLIKSELAKLPDEDTGKVVAVDSSNKTVTVQSDSTGAMLVAQDRSL